MTFDERVALHRAETHIRKGSATLPSGRPGFARRLPAPLERKFFIDNLLVGTHFIIEMFCWTGLAPWEFEFHFPGSLISTFLVGVAGMPSMLRGALLP